MRLRLLTSCIASLLLAFAASRVSAQDTYFWNPSGNPEFQGGSGTIDTTTPLWNTSSSPSDTLVAWTNGSHAIFGGTGGTITSNHASLTTGNVTFQSAAYTLAGALTLGMSGNLIVQQSGSLTVTDALSIDKDLAIYNGTLNVNGSSFTTTTNGYIGVDNISHGRLNITNGGSASFVHSSVGTQTSSYGFITVDGAGSTFANSGNLYIGQDGHGELTVRNGASASTANLDVSHTSGSYGSATVEGAGSTLTVSGQLLVGSGGSAELKLKDGGTLVGGANTLLLGESSSLRIGQDDSAAGTIQAAAISSNRPGATVSFGHSDAALDFSTPIMATVAVEHTGSGTTILNADNFYYGGTTISAGTLRLGRNQAMGYWSGDLTLAGGTLDLAGFAQDSDLLYVSASSTIDFSGNSSLILSNSSAHAWDGLLTLLNFGAGDTFRIGTDGSGLTADQLNRIIIDGFYGQIDASGYITASAISAVPEPSTYAMIFGLGVLSFTFWRRTRSA